MATLKKHLKDLLELIEQYGEEIEVEFLDSDMNEYYISFEGELIENDDPDEESEPVLRCYID